jgi:hypothetical protein
MGQLGGYQFFLLAGKLHHPTHIFPRRLDEAFITDEHCGLIVGFSIDYQTINYTPHRQLELGRGKRNRKEEASRMTGPKRCDPGAHDHGISQAIVDQDDEPILQFQSPGCPTVDPLLQHAPAPPAG